LTARIRIRPEKVEIAAEPGEMLGDVLRRAGISLENECGGQGTCGRCAVRLADGRCDGGASENLDAEKARQGYVLACQARVLSDLVVDVPEESRAQRASGCAPYLVPETEVPQIDDLSPLSVNRAGPAAPRLGIACDIGTTTVALKLVELSTGRVLDIVADYNGQMGCGADVLSRILYARKATRLQELRDRVVRTINGLIDTALGRHSASSDAVTAATFAGNTTMTYLLLGFDPQPIRQELVASALKPIPELRGADLGLHVNPAAEILVSPFAGSWVGGDITAGMLCVALKNRRPRGAELFIDIGTNGEMVLAGETWMIGCACSAGPAFEGVGIRCGMRATGGAIETASVRHGGRDVSYRVIGDQAPRGICGSGLIELVADLFTSGVIGRDGKLTDRIPADRLRADGRQRSFIVVAAGESGTGREISISERDITNIMRAKAAIFSACRVFLRNVGLAVADIERVYVAGGFGCHLNVAKAITMGLFPDVDAKRFEYLGNTSLLGAYLALVSASQRKRLADIAKRMTYVDLSSEPGYMDEYTAAMFLPHTDTSLFPRSSKQ
jgi:uncharacterized 2Fe-2S/4Fe-4S cluster protein (DUF4445 family)